jgi:hypothetical protein
MGNSSGHGFDPDRMAGGSKMDSVRGEVSAKAVR